MFLLLSLAVWLCLAVLTLRAALGLVSLLVRDWRPTGAALTITRVIDALTDPPLLALRRVLPPLRFGGLSLDPAFLVLYVVLLILQRWLPW